ncbi:MAG: hypothetical protein WAV76_09370 [Bacteroidota bacterium]
MAEFKSGETVFLKQGSPAMSVKESVNVDDDPNECIVCCNWFVSNKVFEHEFRAEQLTREDPKSI